MTGVVSKAASIAAAIVAQGRIAPGVQRPARTAGRVWVGPAMSFPWSGGQRRRKHGVRKPRGRAIVTIGILARP